MADINLSIYETTSVVESKTVSEDDRTVSVLDSAPVSEDTSAVCEFPWVDFVKVTESVTVLSTREISEYESVTVSEYIEKNEVGMTDPRENYWPKFPVRSLEASGGIVGVLDANAPDRTVYGRGGGNLSSVLSTRSLSAQGSYVESGSLNTKRGNYSCTGFSGGRLDKSVSSREIYAIGTGNVTGKLDVTIPVRTLQATGIYEVFGSLEVTIPQRTLSASGFCGSGSLDKKFPVRYVSSSYMTEEIHGDSSELVFPVRRIEATGECLSGGLNCEISPRVMTYSVIGKESGSVTETSRFDSSYVLEYSR